MSDMQFPLRERTTLIFGPFNSLSQLLIQKLTELGSDCILLSEQSESALSFCSSVSEAKMIHTKRGRAHSIAFRGGGDSEIVDSVRACAQLFNAIDLFVDMRAYEFLPGMKSATERFNDEQTSKIFRKYFSQSLLVMEEVIPFFQTRRRGRLIFLNRAAVDLWKSHNLVRLSLAARTGLAQYAMSIADELACFNIAVNVLEVNLLEEDLLFLNSQKSVKEHLLELQAQYPSTRLLDLEKVTSLIGMLLAPSGGLINKQIFST